MTTSTIFGIPYLASQQATPEIPHNEALYMLEALLHGVKAIQNAPPGAPVDGDTYIVGTAGSGAWLGKNNCIASYAGNGWVFIPGFDSLGAQIAMGTKQEGLQVYNQALDGLYRWTGAAWVTASSLTPDNSIALAKLINATAQGNFINRRSAGPGAWEESTLAQTKTLLAYTAADVVNVPAGTIAATNVQTALNELDTEKYTPASNTFALSNLANAAAQFDIIGRKTAGGGAWEDCTRTQLGLAGTALANTFTAAQTINAGSNLGPGAAGFTLRSDTGGTFGPAIVTYHNSASPAVNDIPFIWQVYGKNSAAADYVYGQFYLNMSNITPGAEAGEYVYQASLAGAIQNVMYVGNGVVFGGATGSFQGIGSANAAGYYANGNLAIDSNALLRTRAYTVGTLPTASGVDGAIARVTDSLAAPVYNAAAVGGGTTKAQVKSDGTIWRYN